MRPNSYQPQPQPPSQSQSYPTSLPRSSTFIHQSQPHPTTLPRSSTFVHQPQFRSNPSTSSTSNLQFRSREETREENDLRLALLASQQDHENHLIELERREKLLIEKARKESERAEADRIELEKVRLASIEESERKILESVLRESRLQSQSNHPSNHSTNDHDQYQLELALAISLNESNPTQTSQFEHSSSSHPINNLHHHQPSQPIPLRSTQSASTLQHSTSHSSFTTARTDVNESDSFNHHTSARFTENQHSNSSSYHSNSVLNNHSPLQSSNRDHVLTPTVTSSELHSNRTIRRPSRPLPQPPSRPSSQVQITPLDHSSQRTTHNELHSLRLSTTAPGSQSPSITRASHDDFPTSLIERPALLIRTRSDQFVPFPDLRDGQEHDTTRPSSATQLCQGEEEEDEAIKEALMRARRASHYSASFIGLENEEGDVFDSHEGSDGTPIQSPTASPSVSDDSKTFVCNPRPSGSLSEGVKYGLIGGSHHSLDSGQFPDLGIGINF
ncbi:hypothetical protein DFH28DRAFT_1091714 [Melampsora americana]|nr:hypothetical protein DFH28DRAFT_1091714 [Melampsora americana]